MRSWSSIQRWRPAENVRRICLPDTRRTTHHQSNGGYMAGSMHGRGVAAVGLTVVALLGQVGCTSMPASTTSAPSVVSSVVRAPFGRATDGKPAELFTLTNARGIEVRLTNYGGIITSLRTPDRSGRFDDIALGYDSLSGYLKDTPYFGAIVGRYGNRIARGRFTIDGTTYRLAINNGPNTLHGGLRGFDKVVWNAVQFQNASGVGVTLDYTSADMEEGYPGTLRTRVTYTLTDDNRLIVDYLATSDKPTPINLTQHSYWNLAGDGTRDILGHELTINADSMTPVDSTLIPTGEITPVAGTPFDFRTSMPIGLRIDQRQNTQIRYGGGYDHNFVLNRRSAAPDSLLHAARVFEPTTGRTLDVFTTEPGMQFYTGNFLDGSITGKSGHIYHYRYGLALETQHYPDSPNHPNFPSSILRPGQQYKTRTVFAFGVAR
jgi:aldose 1-epimerase